MHFLRVSFTPDAPRIRAKAQRHHLGWQHGALISPLSDDSFYETALKCHEFPTLKCCVMLFYVTYLEIRVGLALFQNVL